MTGRLLLRMERQWRLICWSCSRKCLTKGAVATTGVAAAAAGVPSTRPRPRPRLTVRRNCAARGEVDRGDMGVDVDNAESGTQPAIVTEAHTASVMHKAVVVQEAAK